MQAIPLDLSKGVFGSDHCVIDADIRFSLKPFISFITNRIATEKTAKVNFYRYLLSQFEAFPELDQPVTPEDAGKYHHLFELIYTALSPLLNDEHEQVWAISKPITPSFYYGTDAFYNILLDKENKLKSGLTLPSKTEMEKSMLTNFYDLILEKFYHISLGSSKYTVKSMLDEDTHLLKYYRLNVDVRFIEVKCKTELPEISKETAKEYLKGNEDNLEVLQRILPSELFTIEGLSIMTMTDVTAEYALESVKNAIIDHNKCEEGWSSDRISAALKSLVGTDDIDFGLLPYIKLNSKTMIYSHTGFESIIIQQAKENGLPEKDYTALVDSFVEHPRRLIFPEITEEQAEEYPMLRLIMDKGVKSYALFPLYYNAKLVGCLELYAKDITAFNGTSMSRIEGAFSLLAQLFQNIITDFNYEIMGIVTDKFTALQPSVAWRFYQAAYNYLKSGALEKGLLIESVQFKDVYPFYAAIDIRNSSIERNLMIRKDLYAHFDILETMLRNLKSKFPDALKGGFPQEHSGWKEKGFADLSDREIMRTDDYLQRQLPPYLKLLRDVHTEIRDIVDEYFELTAPGGKIYANRENYELSMQMINHAANRHLDEFNASIQGIFPCYFEKFRTDGVEFDIYLGQSIAPELKFTDEIVHDFRLRQLRVIAEIGRTTGNLTAHLPLPLETTQLIFVYEKLIDISFRTDEQRFDVEGSYNIRYQMVKKRIDKAHVKDSTERLTQPGKIAIVYFNSSEAQEYLGYIKILQSEGLLTEVVEYIEIEELQGVEGLKALRVEVAKTYE